MGYVAEFVLAITAVQGYTTDVMPTLVQSPQLNTISSTSSSEEPDVYQLSSAATRHESRNFAVLVVYQILMRTGWIFKTESIVMPAVLDTITGGGPMGGLLRGCLPILNRLGHGIPPMLFARRLKLLPRKCHATIISTLCMAAVFAGLSGMWWVVGNKAPWWMPFLFLLSYLLFFAVTGINNLSVGTLQGKLIHATRRGRLFLMSNFLGAAVAIVAVLLLLPQWLTEQGGRFEMVFGFTAICFVASAMVLLLVAEPQDRFREPDRGVRHTISAAFSIVRTDVDFRKLALVSMAFSTSLTLFPHYQALGRSQRLDLSFDNLMVWVILQNVGTALFSLIMGPIADRRGNRIVMHGVLISCAATPLAAILLSYWQNWGAMFYPLVFLFVGITPIGFKTLNNYALEICTSEDHPRYLSTLGICFAVPLLLSPLCGWLIEITSFEMIFFSVSGIVFTGWLLAFRMPEPRQAIIR